MQVARVIQRNIRDQDVAARWGGEELAVYLPKARLNAGEMLAERLIMLVRECTDPTVTISCGVSHWSQDRPKSLSDLLKKRMSRCTMQSGTGKQVYDTLKRAGITGSFRLNALQASP
ncbi:diguanylate cyclase [Bacillus licheniformis]|nr:diguanylate cyclase [Bacillus licheniformis]